MPTTDDAEGFTVRQKFVVRPLWGGILEHVFTGLVECPQSWLFLTCELGECLESNANAENRPSGEAARACK
jgi:hypothetical protein